MLASVTIFADFYTDKFIFMNRAIGVILCNRLPVLLPILLWQDFIVHDDAELQRLQS